MNYREARQLVLENMQLMEAFQRKPDTFVLISATVFGQDYQDWDTAKYNLADQKKEGKRFSRKIGLDIATGRAVKRIAKRVMRCKTVVLPSMEQVLAEAEASMEQVLTEIEEHVPPS